MEWILDIGLAVLLTATLFHAVRLERALGVLKRDRAALETLVATFNASTRAAESGVERLRATTDGAGKQIQRQIDAATSLKDDLTFLVQRGEGLADRMDDLVRAARPLAAAAPVLPEAVAEQEPREVKRASPAAHGPEPRLTAPRGIHPRVPERPVPEARVPEQLVPLQLMPEQLVPGERVPRARAAPAPRAAERPTPARTVPVPGAPVPAAQVPAARVPAARAPEPRFAELQATDGPAPTLGALIAELSAARAGYAPVARDPTEDERSRDQAERDLLKALRMAR